jgi:hypothetical protein
MSPVPYAAGGVYVVWNDFSNRSVMTPSSDDLDIRDGSYRSPTRL